VKATDFKTLPELAVTLADDGWVIYKYEVIGPERVALTIARKEREPEGENG